MASRGRKHQLLKTPSSLAFLCCTHSNIAAHSHKGLFKFQCKLIKIKYAVPPWHWPYFKESRVTWGPRLQCQRPWDRMFPPSQKVPLDTLAAATWEGQRQQQQKKEMSICGRRTEPARGLPQGHEVLGDRTPNGPRLTQPWASALLGKTQILANVTQSRSICLDHRNLTLKK